MDVFKAFAEQSVSVNRIATSEVSTPMTLDGARRNNIHEEKQQILSERLGLLRTLSF